MDVDEVPTYLPARMLNEYVYCPRLFYLEWVDDRWADSDDTEEGRFAHRVVDREGGRMPAPEAADLLREVRSLRVDDPELGLLAVIDRIEGRNGAAVPVDLKKGSPSADGQPWPADLAQLHVQAVLLRRAGYRVEEGVIYYAGTNHRVTVTVPEDIEAEVGELVAAARSVAHGARPPLPLVDSPKCPRCSLVGLCLPDETNALLRRAERPPRRIVPRDPDDRPVYVTEQGAYVGIKGGRLEIRKKKEVVEQVRLIDVAQLNVFGHIQVSSEALAALWAQGSPVLWFSYGGWLRGWAQGEPSRYVELRRRQVLVHGRGGEGIAAAIIAGKISNARTLLRRNARAE